MSISWDAAEILNHLNHLGYRNITADQLKEFQKDLKRLVKFDSQINTGLHDERTDKSNVAESVFERLHCGKTISYQAKARTVQKDEKSDYSDKENRSVKQLSDQNIQKPSKMWIRPKSCQNVRRGDPVALYHAYQKDWNKFKQKLPGENNHSELRWKIRTKLLGE